MIIGSVDKTAETQEIMVFTNISECDSMKHICKHSDKESTCMFRFTERLSYAERKRMRICGRWLLRGAPKYESIPRLRQVPPVIAVRYECTW